MDAPSSTLARTHEGADEIEYVVGDVFDHPFATESFDLVASVAALHHMDAAAGLRRMRELLRPGGTLAVVGLARSRFPADLPRQAAALLVNTALRPTKTYREHSAPTVWPPPETYAGMRQVTERILPGSRFRRHLLWRYSITWTKPPA